VQSASDPCQGQIIQYAQCERAHEAPPHWRPYQRMHTLPR